MSSAPSPKIVVGVDGSATAEQALRWAVRQAELSGGQVHAVDRGVEPCRDVAGRT
jgi:nucleotide-binding universal stress UspA family protein